MKLDALVFMLFSWIIVIGLLFLCFLKIMKGKNG